MEREVLIHIDDAYKHFGASKAVDGVTIDIYKGEVCGLVGENGSGKSTLLSLISGINKKDSGEILLEGRSFTPKNLADANRNGVSMIVQEANTIPGLTVAENMYLGIEDEFVRCGIRNLKAMNAAAKEKLAEVDLSGLDPSADIANYSMEQRKLVELVKAAAIRPKLLMIDETSTALSQKGREELYRLIHSTKAQGNSVLLISHDLQEVLTYCDRVIVMRDGKIVTEVNSADVDEAQLKNLMVGRTLSGKYYREDYDTPVSDEIVLSVRGLSCRSFLRGVDLDLHRGEILGIGGLSESGMHELGKAIFGIEYGISGEITLANGEKISGIESAVRHDIGYVSKNRDMESLFNLTDISDNIAATCMKNIAKGGFVSTKRINAFAEKAAQLLNIKMNGIHQIVGTLSGGNKQKVALTKWIVRGTEIFIMDSPTRGIDVGVKSVIYDLLDNLRKQGKSLIVISEELLELIGMCDRILILKDGEISHEFKRDPQLSEEQLVQYMI